MKLAMRSAFSRRPPLGALLGGIQYLIPSSAHANSVMNFFVFDEPAQYSLSGLKHNRRSNIKKGLRYFVVRQITDLQEFIDAAYPAYLSFYSRTGYSYKKERQQRNLFGQWAQTLFSFPKILILGAYHENHLSAVHVSYVIEDVLIFATFFSHTEALRMRVADVIMHTLRERAAACPLVRVIFVGMVTGQKGLDEFKLGQGCKILSKPAFFKINPLARFFVKTFLLESYRKLLGLPANVTEFRKEAPSSESLGTKDDSSAHLSA